MKVKLSPDQKIQVANSDDIYKVMQQILLRENRLRRGQEYFWVVGLSNSNKILFVELVSLGANNRVMVHPPEVFRMGIYKLAVNIVLVHNHPSGNLAVSRPDRDFTDRMIKSGDMLNIKVIDHMIISEEKYYSFENDGLMMELRNSGLYELVEREKLQLNEIKTEGIKRIKTKEIAANFKKAGVDIETIKKATGLSKAEIRTL
ncbi:hypothetical protein WSM22_37790 [Cytophagales bacterium WSM2-2]|nr:hypothetical protein WSM22_37790 [Cytophagales bacterium WSM2-2]